MNKGVFKIITGGCLSPHFSFILTVPCFLALTAYTDHSECPRDDKSDRKSQSLCTVRWGGIERPGTDRQHKQDHYYSSTKQ